jgi:AhpD family alkylhydroperoxidase
MIMEDKVKLLIAVGAAVTANCQPCLRTAVSQAQIAKVEKKEILEAIQIGRLVRRGANGKMDVLASTLTANNVGGSEEECPFGSTEQEVKEWINQEEPENTPQCGCK